MLQNKIYVLILQHPQEKKKIELNTAPVLLEELENLTIRHGLSWRNLTAALESTEAVDPKKWAVLYYGSGPTEIKNADPLKNLPLLRSGFLDRKGAYYPKDIEKKILHDIEGLVLLDGTWSQAKSLWWRNSWLLKLHRLILKPDAPSKYGELRQEPKPACVSTIEAARFALHHLKEDVKVLDSLKKAEEAFFEKLHARSTKRPPRSPH